MTSRLNARRCRRVDAAGDRYIHRASVRDTVSAHPSSRLQAAARGRRARQRVAVLRHEEVAATFDEPWEVAHRSAAQRGRGHYKPRHAVRTARLNGHPAVGQPVRIC